MCIVVWHEVSADAYAKVFGGHSAYDACEEVEGVHKKVFTSLLQGGRQTENKSECSYAMLNV